jgi:hypothetical protein
MRELEEKIKNLRSVMEYWECFFHNDDVGIALVEVEEALKKINYESKD